MKRVVFATAITAITFVAAYGASNAAPIAPLPNAVTENTRNVIQAYYYHHHYYPYYSSPLVPSPLALLVSRSQRPAALSKRFCLPARWWLITLGEKRHEQHAASLRPRTVARKE